MSFILLADQLTDVARLLREHPSGLDAKSAIAEADKFAKALAKFRGVLEGVAAGRSPEVQALARELTAAFTGDDKGLKTFSKRHVPPKGVSFTAKDTAAQRAEKVAAKIAALGRTEAAWAELRRREAPSVLDFSSREEIALLVQIRRLGQLPEDERVREGQKLLAEPEKIQTLARAAKLKFTARTSAKTLLKNVLEMGVRYAENTGR